MKKIVLTMACVFMAAGYINAQTSDRESRSNDGKMNEYDEIIIKRKDKNKDGKVTVEIKGDEVFVDGKPIDDFVDEEIAVKIRSPRRFRLNSSPFIQDGTWTPEGDDDSGTERAFLGVSAEGSAAGAKLIRVSDNSPAEKAGLKSGDVITKIDDKEVFDHEQLVKVISDHKPNDKITVNYTRNGKKNKAEITLAGRRISKTRTFRGFGPNAPEAPEAPEPPEDMDVPMPPIPPHAYNFKWDDEGFNHLFQFKGKPRLGIKAQDTEDGKGVVVLDVDDDSPADKAGLKEDDIITSFDGKTIGSVEELSKLSREAGEKSPLKMEVNRKGKTQNLEIRIPKKLRTTTL
jgi:serine protease Do